MSLSGSLPRAQQGAALLEKPTNSCCFPKHPLAPDLPKQVLVFLPHL